ncbi:MAG: hypothetical protein GXY19_07585 [Phycisphaerae bacterium]|nr:hypothetical protein [Phycisphaerae bacterium]
MACFRTGSAGRWAGCRSRTRWAGRDARPGLGVQQGQQQRQVGANNHSPLRLQWAPSGGGGGGSSTTDWEQITYTYDPSGRRIAKDVDGEVMAAAGGPRPTLRLGYAFDAGQALS